VINRATLEKTMKKYGLYTSSSHVLRDTATNGEP
jgi:hypothetical protein